MSKMILIDDKGENQAVRMFLSLYGGACGVTSEQMRKHLTMAGFDGAWPEWENSNNGHLTKAGAQLWIRHLFALEQPAQHQEPVAWRDPTNANPGQGCTYIKARAEKSPHIYKQALYTSPPASKPWVGLTDEEIGNDPIFRVGVRFAESKHGIGEKK